MFIMRALLIIIMSVVMWTSVTFHIYVIWEGEGLTVYENGMATIISLGVVGQSLYLHNIVLYLNLLSFDVCTWHKSDGLSKVKA